MLIMPFITVGVMVAQVILFRFNQERKVYFVVFAGVIFIAIGSVTGSNVILSFLFL